MHLLPYSYAQSNASYQMLLSRSNFAKKPHVEMLNILHSSQLFLLTKDFFACQRLLYMNKFRTFAVGCITLRIRVRHEGAAFYKAPNRLTNICHLVYGSEET